MVTEKEIKVLLSDVLTCVANKLALSEAKALTDAVFEASEDIQDIVRCYVKVKNNLVEGNDVLHQSTI